MRLTNHLVVMAKAPRLGRVKRRLAAAVGDQAALAFYRRALPPSHRRACAVKRRTDDTASAYDG